MAFFTRERVEKEVKERGHPLCWAEWKPVQLFSALYRHWQSTEIVDLSPGSGAACLAALYANIPYQGICYNAAQEVWLQDLFKKAIVALVATKAVEADKDVVANVLQYLQRTAEAAKQLLPNKNPIEDACADGADDSASE